GAGDKGGTGSSKLSITDDSGNTFAANAYPKRVISIAPSVTETFFALGAGNILVGRSDADNFPAEAAKLPPVATYGTVSLETISSLHADVVIDANLFGPDAL